MFSAEDLAAIVQVHRAAGRDAGRGTRAAARAVPAAAGVRSAEAVTFLVPRRDATGKAQSPSESLVFMQRLFAGPEIGGRARHRARCGGGAGAGAACRARGARRRRAAAGARGRGSRVRARSASRCGWMRRASRSRSRPAVSRRLMVSRLTWLLRRLEAEPLDWAPEAAGSGAARHARARACSRACFKPGVALPDAGGDSGTGGGAGRGGAEADRAVPARVVVGGGATALHRADDQGGAGVARDARAVSARRWWRRRSGSRASGRGSPCTARRT